MQELSWSPWRRFDDDPRAEIPAAPGLYRVRHHTDIAGGLTYIGESSDIRRRIGSLVRGTHAERMPYRDPHTAAPCLWAIRHRDGPGFSVSHTTLGSEDAAERKGIEAALIAIHRHETGRSPTAQFGRIIPGYTQSSYRTDGVRGGPTTGDDADGLPASVRPGPWTRWDRPQTWGWMDQDWVEDRRLGSVTTAAVPPVRVYRIHEPAEGDALTYIGQSRALPLRLRTHARRFGPDLWVSWADRDDLSTQAARLEGREHP
jgi:hypothetical protein